MENRRIKTNLQSTLTNSDITTWELPDGAIARLGRGGLRNISFSPDGRYLAIATSIGCWLYDQP